MNRKFWLLAILLSTMAIFAVYSSTYIAKANAAGVTQKEDYQQIKEVITKYFDTRYKSFQSFNLGDFSGLTKNNPEMQKEIDKMNLQLFHASTFHLRYQNYHILLDFGNIIINQLAEMASVNIVEGSDVVFENAPSKQPTSKMRNQTHLIGLQKENNVWKITNDNYEDYFWRELKATKLSHNDFKKNIAEAGKQWEAQVKNAKLDIQTDNQSVPSSLSSSHILNYYDRSSAVNYAYDHYNNYNDKFIKFTGVDCTNFVSQAMYIGGQLPMTGRKDIHDIAGGWWYDFNNTPNYIYDDNKSPAWAGVDQLYEFLVLNQNSWIIGPSGQDYASPYNLKIGDIIQYDWKNPPVGYGTPVPTYVYDHSVIVVLVDRSAQFVGVASHSPDLYNHPYEEFINMHDDGIYTQRQHFIHILSAPPLIFIPALVKTGATMQGGYPAPGQNIHGSMSTNLGYPAPMQNNDIQPNLAYPVPASTDIP